jgi:hypothetical protein
MTNFLFWNVARNNLAVEIANAARENDVDVLILAENQIGDVPLLDRLNDSVGNRPYISPFNPSNKLSFYTRYNLHSLTPVFDEGGIAVRSLRLPIGPEILLVALHLPSKLHRSQAEQTIYSTRVSDAIVNAEIEAKHQNSIVIGDLNMNPFEDGVVAAHGIHAVADRAIALEMSRVVDGDVRSYFYNPMWGRLGDETSGPPGTYFRRGGEINLFWHTFDQVLLRPSMIKYYSSNSLRVVTSIAGQSLLTSGRINANISDHLPVFLNLELERGT